MYKFQLAVACSVGEARIVHTCWVPYGEHVNFVSKVSFVIPSIYGLQVYALHDHHYR